MTPATLAAAFVSALTLLLAPHTHGKRETGYGQIGYDGHGPEWWARRWKRTQMQVRVLRNALRKERRELLRQPTVVEAINLSCATYGYCTTLWRKAQCESQLDRYAHNPSGASGLFQFLPSTFASTPYARMSIYSPYANALAAGWMHAHGRGGEWVCR